MFRLLSFIKKVFYPSSIYKSTSLEVKPFETITLPILRNFYPKLIASQLVNVMPIDKPDIIKPFMKIKRNSLEELEKAPDIKDMNEKQIQEHVEDIYDIFKNS